MDLYSFRPLIRGLSISSKQRLVMNFNTVPFPSPHPGIINFFSDICQQWLDVDGFPSPHPGIINFFVQLNDDYDETGKFPSPHPGIINFFRQRFQHP